MATNTTVPSLIGGVHHFVVTTTATGLTVSMDGTQVLTYTTRLPPYVLVGFTGATGGINDIHQVQNVSITAGPPPPMPTVNGVSPASGPTTGGTDRDDRRLRVQRRHGGELRGRRPRRTSRS